MADQYHLSLLQEGADSWNQWRGQAPEIHPDLSGAKLSGSDLRGVNLSEANLAQALLNESDLQGALFWRATLRECDLHGADLRQAHFYQADLRHANLSGSNLEQAHFREALLNGTNLSNIDLSSVKGLGSVRHEGRSYLDIHTLYRSQGQIPEAFLRGIGAPEHFILYANTMPQAPIQYLSCFISSSQSDSAFVSRLYADLQQQGIRCWSIFHDLKNEHDDIEKIKETIQRHDTWLIVLSEYTLISEWVRQEIDLTVHMEQQQKRTILFPLCLHQDFLDLNPNNTMSLLQNRQTRSFIGWQDATIYEQAFAALLQDLKKAA